jgi:carboxypeptidase Q
MLRHLRLAMFATLATCSLPGVVAQAQQPSTPPAEAPKPPTDPIERIKDEALNKSQVMATLSYLTDVIGPRLTASPNMKRANEWTKEKLASWGLENAHLEKWGTFGKGWALKKFSIQVIEPHCIPLIAFPKAWSPGIEGTVVGEVVDLDAVKTEADLEKLKGKLKGAFVMLGPPIEVEAHFEALGSRLTDKELLEMANADSANARRPRQQRPAPAATTPAAPGAAATTPTPAPAGPGGRGQMTPEMLARLTFQRKKMTFAMEEGAVATLDGSSNGDGGTLFVASATVPSGPLPGAGGPGGGGARRVSAYDKDVPKILPQVTISKEHYNRVLRMIRQGEHPKIALELAVEFQNDVDTFNTVAEIPGTDLKDEIVMLGGHMDSWHSGTGATDNAAGVSVAMEVVRILKALDFKPRRTIRIALWSGEEQGLLGSAAYVKEHLGQTEGGNRGGGGGGFGGGGPNAPRPKVTTKPEYEKFAGYFNLDNGTGKIRGVYLQGNEAARSVFRPWLTPFKEMGASTLTIANTSGTDHLSFDAIGLPGFQFIQDVVEYDSRTHHSNQDLFDRIQADDMKQAAAIMAAFVYNTANRDEKIPRKSSVTTSPTTTPSPTPPTTAGASAAGN